MKKPYLVVILTKQGLVQNLLEVEVADRNGQSSKSEVIVYN